MKHLATVTLLVAACGDDGGGSVLPDARMIDSGTVNKVVEVGCPASPAATVMSTNLNDSSYMPMSTVVSAGAIVKFVMSSNHDVAPNPIGTSDPGLVVDYGETKCLQFNTAGMYGFFCEAHSFAGKITVN